MEPGMAELIKQWGAAGAIILLLGGYVLKREVSFSTERKTYIEMVGTWHKDAVDMATKYATFQAEQAAKLDRLEALINRLERATGASK